MSKTKSNVYTDNRKAYSSVLESAASNAKGWRLATFIMCFITLAAVFGVVYIGSQSKIKPLVITVDGFGVPMRLYRVDESTDIADKRIVKATIAQVISTIRSVFVDAGIMKRELDEVIHFFEKSQPGFARVQRYLTENATNPFKRAQRELVNVQINNVIQLTDVTWQVEWTEEISDRSGNLIESKSYKGTVTIGHTDQISEETIYINPTGLLIKDLVWSQQVN